LCHPVHLVSLGFGSGLSPFAPGTMGTLAAWLLYPLLRIAPLSDIAFLTLLLAFFVAGVFATHHTGKVLGVPDHGAIVWDEMVAMWLVLSFTPSGFSFAPSGFSFAPSGFIWQAIAVALFRLFDILKPPPIRQADSRFKNGFGVMFDDLLAAAYALLALAALIRLHAMLFGAGI
jgi:phosphatidylglycerophosphatase A